MTITKVHILKFQGRARQFPGSPLLDMYFTNVDTGTILCPVLHVIVCMGYMLIPL